MCKLEDRKVLLLWQPLMLVLCVCVPVTSTPSDSDSSRPDEDTFGVSFLLNDVDETASKDVAPGVTTELCVSNQI